jgi:hypothetical protein
MVRVELLALVQVVRVEQTEEVILSAAVLEPVEVMAVCMVVQQGQPIKATAKVEEALFV